MEGVATITEAIDVMDGGSTSLSGLDPSGAPLRVWLEWSAGTAPVRQLRVNGVSVPIGSAAEGEWVKVLASATIAAGNAGLSEAVASVIERVLSREYQSQRLRPPLPTAEEEVHLLLSAGKNAEAVKVWRRAHPALGMAEARAAVRAIKLK